jgi:hypothetical protein
MTLVNPKTDPRLICCCDHRDLKFWVRDEVNVALCLGLEFNKKQGLAHVGGLLQRSEVSF